MDYKHIRNITELFVREFSECKSFSELILGYTLCNHNIESLTKEKFCLNVGNELDCPAYRLIWITPNGTLLFTKPVPLCVELMDHRETVTYVLKKYYKLVPAKEKTEILKNFFGNIYDNPKLINFFESESNTKECIPKGLYGDFDSEEFGYRKNNYVGKCEKKKTKKVPRFTCYFSRFMHLTGFVRIRLKDRIIKSKNKPDNISPLRENTGLNIESWAQLSLNQQQFLREFILINKLNDYNAVFLDDNTPYSSLSSSLGFEIKEKFHTFGHAYRLLNKK